MQDAEKGSLVDSSSCTTMMEKHNWRAEPWLSRSDQTLAFAASAGFIAYWVRSVLSVAIIRLAAELSLDDSTVTVALTAFFYGYFVSNAGYAMLARRFRPCVLLLGAVAGSSFITIMIPNVLHAGGARSLVVCRILSGLAQGALFPSIYAIFAAEYTRDSAARTRAISFLGATPSLGIAMNLLVSPLLMDSLGWQATLRTAGMLAIPWALMWCRSPMMRDALEVLPQKGADTVDDAAENALVVEILKSPPFYGVVCGHFAHSWMNYVTLAWLPLYLRQELHMSGGSMALACLPYIVTAIVVPFAGTCLPRYLQATGLDLWGVRRTMAMGGLLVPGAAILAMPCIPASMWPLPLVCITVCLAFSALVQVSVLATPLDIAGPRASGVMFSMSNTVASVPGFVGIQMVSMLHECCGWRVAFGSCTILYILAAIVYGRVGHAQRIFA